MKWESMIGIFTVLDAVKATSGFTGISFALVQSKVDLLPVLEVEQVDTDHSVIARPRLMFCWSRIFRLSMVGRAAVLR